MKIQTNRSQLIFFMPVLLALVSLGCGLSGILDRSSSVVENQPTPTRTPMPTFTPTPAGEVFIDVAVVGNQQEVTQPQQPASEVSQPLEPPTPTATLVVQQPPPEPTATPVPEAASVTLIQNMNVRGGPGTNYSVIGPGPAGESAKILGRNQDGSWLQIEYPSADGTGWVYAPLVQINGDAQAVAMAAAPPPPPPTPVPEPTEPPPPPPPPEPQYQFTPTGWHASGNPGIVHFKGRIKDEAGNLVNGYSVLVDNWSWSIMSHPSGASHHYPEKGDGEWDVVIPNENLGDGVGWWWLSVVRYECPDFLSRFEQTRSRQIP